MTNGKEGKAKVTKGGGAVTFQFTSSSEPSDNFTYTISDGFGGSATGQVNVINYATHAGTYSAVLLDPASQNAGSGFLRVSLTATGQCTGALTIEGVMYPFTGAFDSSGQFVTMLNTSAPYGTTVTLTMVPAGSEYELSAGVTMNAMRLVANMALASTGESGAYTLLIPPPRGASYVGSGYALVQIATSGQTTIAGALPDGAPFSCSTVTDATGREGVFSLLYGASNPGSLSGTLAVSGSGNTMISGTLIWTKPALSSAGINQGPFSIALTGSGGRYVVPVSAAALQFGTGGNTGHVVLSGGNLNSAILHGLSIAPNNLVTILGSGNDGLAVTIQPATGLFIGHFTDPLNGVTRTVHGALLQSAKAGGGYFLGDSTGGAIGIGP